jgi:hypothetical protein
MDKLASAIKGLLISLTVLSPLAKAAELVVTPNKCVALRKGQTCYQKLSFVFATNAKGNYCLVSGSNREPLQCWNAVSDGTFTYSHAAESAVEFSLINAQRVAVASTTVNIAWVYKKSRKRSRWRLF